jgi:hypothetical protein
MVKLSRFDVRTALDFGIYYNRENQEYLYKNKEKYGSPQEAFDVIKSEIHSILKVEDNIILTITLILPTFIIVKSV